MEPKRKNTSKHVQVCHFIIFCHIFYHYTAFRVKRESHSHMSHTRETWTRLRADWVRILALDGTERTKHAKHSRVTHSKQQLTITAQKLKVTGAAPSSPNSSHQGNTSTREQPWERRNSEEIHKWHFCLSLFSQLTEPQVQLFFFLTSV